MPALDKKKLYLIGFVFMPRHMVKNFDKFMPIMCKDMAHLRYPANGSLFGYAMINAAGHIELPIVGMILACEDASSWNVCDTTLTAVIPGADDEKVAITGDGQKGELASHKNGFRKGLLRSCYRHRLDEYKGTGANVLLAKRAYQVGVFCRKTDAIAKVMTALKRRSPAAYAKVMNVPLARQFPAYAIEAGYGPLRGRNTSNLIEVR